MKRLISVAIITIVIGVFIIFLVDTVKNNQEETNDDGVTYIFNVDYAEKISIDNLPNLINTEEYVMVFIGDDSQTSAKMSTFLGEIVKDYDLKVYYLARTDKLNNNATYLEILNAYENIHDYINFTPVLLVFKNKEFISGYPGEANYSKILSFLSYCEIIEGVDKE